jgi:hypothetical protein
MKGGEGTSAAGRFRSSSLGTRPSTLLYEQHIGQSDRAGAQPQLAGHQSRAAGPQGAFCMMATNVATGLEIEREDLPDPGSDSFRAPHSALPT